MRNYYCCWSNTNMPDPVFHCIIEKLVLRGQSLILHKIFYRSCMYSRPKIQKHYQLFPTHAKSLSKINFSWTWEGMFVNFTISQTLSSVEDIKLHGCVEIEWGAIIKSWYSFFINIARDGSSCKQSPNIHKRSQRKRDLKIEKKIEWYDTNIECI